MSKAPTVLLLSLALAGCAAAPQARLAADPVTPARYAWDGAGEDPNRPKLAAAPSRAPRAESHGDRTVDATEADQDARFSRSLVICKGCLRRQPAEDARLATASD